MGPPCRTAVLVFLGFFLSGQASLAFAQSHHATPVADCLPPVYPANWVIEVTLQVTATVGTDDSLSGMAFAPVDAPLPFRRAAEAALRSCRFAHAVKRGRPVVSTYETIFFFTPPQGSPLQFVMRSREMKDHVKAEEDGRIVINGGAGEPLLSSVQVGDFEATGDIRIPKNVETEAVLLMRAALPPDRIDRRRAGLVIAGGSGRTPDPGTVVDLDGRRLHDPEAGAGVALAAGADEWRPIRVRWIGSDLTVSIDGTSVVSASVEQPIYGRIGVDVSKGAIELRNWHVTRLDRFRDPVPLGIARLADTEAPVTDIDRTAGAKPPKLRHEVRPRYTPAAMDAHRSGTVALEAIVETDGRVGPVRLVSSVDEGLDVEAVLALQQWGFSPALVDGKPVRCVIEAELTFSLGKQP